jgi:hypothetical protein
MARIPLIHGHQGHARHPRLGFGLNFLKHKTDRSLIGSRCDEVSPAEC